MWARPLAVPAKGESDAADGVSRRPVQGVSYRTKYEGGKVYVYREIEDPPRLLGVYSQRSGGIRSLTDIAPEKKAVVGTWLRELFPPRSGKAQRGTLIETIAPAVAR